MMSLQKSFKADSLCLVKLDNKSHHWAHMSDSTLRGPVEVEGGLPLSLPSPGLTGLFATDLVRLQSEPLA